MNSTDMTLQGSTFTFGELCRIKHLPTQLYIVVIRTANGQQVIFYSTLHCI